MEEKESEIEELNASIADMAMESEQKESEIAALKAKSASSDSGE